MPNPRTTDTVLILAAAAAIGAFLGARRAAEQEPAAEQETVAHYVEAPEPEPYYRRYSDAAPTVLLALGLLSFGLLLMVASTAFVFEDQIISLFGLG